MDPEIWQRAGRAINQRERLRLHYQRFDGVIRDYLLEPCHLAAYHGNWYLLALNTAAGRMETFALSRCRSLAGTGQHFARPAAFDPKAFFKDAFGISQADNPGECACSSRVRWRRISANGCGTPASNCGSAGTALWNCGSKPPAARN